MLTGPTFVILALRLLLVLTHASSPPNPELFDLRPTLGPTVGGTVLTFSGAHLTLGSQYLCRFGHGGLLSVGSFQGRSSHGLVTCASPPAGDAGITSSVSVELSLDSGATFTSGGFRFGYYQEAVVLSASPSSGPAAGGTVVSVTSDNVAPTVGLQCAFGSLQRSPATLVDSRTVRCVSPSQTANGSLSVSFEGGTLGLRIEERDMDGHAVLAGAAVLTGDVLELASSSGVGGHVRATPPAPPPVLPSVSIDSTAPVERRAAAAVAEAAAVRSPAVQAGCGVLSLLVLRDTHAPPRGFKIAFELLMAGAAARGLALSYGVLRPPAAGDPSMETQWCGPLGCSSSSSSDRNSSGGASLLAGLWDEFGAARGLSVRFVANSPNHFRPLSIEIALDQQILATTVLGRGALLRGAWAPVIIQP